MREEMALLRPVPLRCCSFRVVQRQAAERKRRQCVALKASHMSFHSQLAPPSARSLSCRSTIQNWLKKPQTARRSFSSAMCYKDSISGLSRTYNEDARFRYANRLIRAHVRFSIAKTGIEWLLNVEERLKLFEASNFEFFRSPLNDFSKAYAFAWRTKISK